MKKFITTSKNEIFTEGKIVEEYTNSSFYQFRVNGIPCDIDIDQWLEEGWLKKVEEKEFTKSDMFDLIEFTNNFPLKMETSDILNDWQKQR